MKVENEAWKRKRGSGKAITMKMANYLFLCFVIAAAVAMTVLYAPGVAETIESRLLVFLSTNAR